MRQAFALQKLLTFFLKGAGGTGGGARGKNGIVLTQKTFEFNVSVSYDIVSFEQTDPGSGSSKHR